MADLDYWADTQHMRTWLRGGGTSIDGLVSELTMWADYWAEKVPEADASTEQFDGLVDG